MPEMTNGLDAALAELSSPSWTQRARAGRDLASFADVSEAAEVLRAAAGGVEPGEAREDSAVRETQEETGLAVAAVKLLGERVHPKTDRLMSYTACDVLGGTAHVADSEELAELAWVARSEIPQYVPYGLFQPVQDYLDSALGA
ncbi:NUDIX hydrolase [Streptomyces microflavus]|uniref:NUDIX hydrolase n=1 Tax=Streptomyces microflavus TaxID=1919 RepID=UPI0033BAE392